MITIIFDHHLAPRSTTLTQSHH